MSKHKKKKDKDKNKAKAKGKAGKGAGSKLKALAENPIVADLVAAALVSTAAALKDPKKARAMAGDAQDELTAMARDASRKGGAMWKLALDVGRQALETLVGEAKGAGKAAKAAKASTKTRAKPAAKTRAKPAVKTVRKAPAKAARPTRKSPATRRKPGAN